MGGAADQLRRRVAALGPRGRGAGLPRPLRAEIIGYARHRHAAGVSVRAIAAATGVSAESVRRWLAARAGRPVGPAPLPVEVLAPPGADGLVLVTPAGHRLEGLRVATAAALLRALA
jgi:hypothetical protein